MLSVGYQATVSYDTGVGSNISGVYAPKSPGANAKYWVANVTVTGLGQKPIDISCGSRCPSPR